MTLTCRMMTWRRLMSGVIRKVGWLLLREGTNTSTPYLASPAGHAWEAGSKTGCRCEARGVWPASAPGMSVAAAAEARGVC